MEILEFEFMQNALAAGLLTAVICGIMGTLVVVNRIVFLSGGIAHAAYGGIGLAYYFKWPLMAGTMGFSLLASLLMAGITLKARHRADTIIGVVWALGMALGIILMDLTPGYNVDLMSYLFGSILTVSRPDLWVMAGTAILVSGLVIWFYQDLLAISYDEEFARIRGVPVARVYCMLIALLGLTIVMVIQVVGLIMVIALLTIPPFILEKRVKSIAGMMVGSSLLGMLFTLCGLWLSYRFDLTSGAAIILSAGAAFLADLAVEKAASLVKGPEPKEQLNV